MDAVIPWDRLIAPVQPDYPKRAATAGSRSGSTGRCASTSRSSCPTCRTPKAEDVRHRVLTDMLNRFQTYT